MKKTIIRFGLLLGSLGGSAQAEVAWSPEISEKVDQVVLSMSENGVPFKAINHFVVTDSDPDPDAPFPVPPDTFVTNGLGVLYSSAEFELTYDYNISGTFTDIDFSGPHSTPVATFTHGSNHGSASNQMHLYLDILGKDLEGAANETNADFFKDGFEIGTFEVFSQPEDNNTGQLGLFEGKDKITFELIEDPYGAFGNPDGNPLFLEIESTILPLDMTSPDNPQPFEFGAFKCGINGPFDSCTKEFGIATITHMPLPPSLGMAILGVGIMSWMGRRKNSENQRS